MRERGVEEREGRERGERERGERYGTLHTKDNYTPSTSVENFLSSFSHHRLKSSVAEFTEKSRRIFSCKYTHHIQRESARVSFTYLFFISSSLWYTNLLPWWSTWVTTVMRWDGGFLHLTCTIIPEGDVIDLISYVKKWRFSSSLFRRWRNILWVWLITPSSGRGFLATPIRCTLGWIGRCLQEKKTVKNWLSRSKKITLQVFQRWNRAFLLGHAHQRKWAWLALEDLPVAPVVSLIEIWAFS